MRDANTILNFIADIYISANPHFFYNEVVYFPAYERRTVVSPFLNQTDVFVDQIDTKLLEEQAENTRGVSTACFFFKS
jgi:hypothetical protein